MKTVTDHAGYAEASSNQKRLQERHAELAAEQQEILAQLRFKEPEPLDVPSLQERAMAIIDGNPLPGGRTELVDGLRNRELEIRGQMEVIAAALRSQPEVVEAERVRARNAAIALRKKEIDGVWSAWDKARDALRNALQAEDDLINGLLLGGFGRAPASITSPDWLNRQAAIIDLKA